MIIVNAIQEWELSLLRKRLWKEITVQVSDFWIICNQRARQKRGMSSSISKLRGNISFTHILALRLSIISKDKTARWINRLNSLSIKIVARITYLPIIILEEKIRTTSQVAKGIKVPKTARVATLFRQECLLWQELSLSPGSKPFLNSRTFKG